jgi:hypothetical protein
MLTKYQAHEIHGGLTETSKMPCKSYSLPTIACQTGYRMAQVKGSICAGCYANKGNYIKYANNIEPVQVARLESISDPLWISAIVASIGTDKYFRWHDSGDLQSVDHLESIAAVAIATPHCRHWLPTREYGIVAAFIANGNAIPDNLVIRLSAMFVDKPVVIPASLKGIAGISASNVHQHSAPIGTACNAPKQNGECRKCRLCWNRDKVISYTMH